MSDYIERDTAVKFIQGLQMTEDEYGKGVRHGIEMALFVLLAYKPSDVAPVLHGTLKNARFDECYCEWGDCSVCGGKNVMAATHCNWCGAKLDGTEESNPCGGEEGD